MRQSGLSPEIIKNLKYGNLEFTKWTPRKIDARQFTGKKTPNFIGEEANTYLKQYLASREDLTSENYLFCTNKNTKIDTGNLSRTFRHILYEIERENKASNILQTTHFQNNTQIKNLSLYSLIRFYQETAKYYEEALKNNPNRNDEFYKRLYEEKAIPFLEINSLITLRLTKKQFNDEIAIRESQSKEMKHTIAVDNNYISSIFTLIYNNKGDPETGEAEKIGNYFLDLWKETADIQRKNLMTSWVSRGKIKLLPLLDIVEELTKTLKRLKKPYNQLEKQTADINKNKGRSYKRQICSKE
jgi:tetratricopeptide (TPR) repeat protein